MRLRLVFIALALATLACSENVVVEGSGGSASTGTASSSSSAVGTGGSGATSGTGGAGGSAGIRCNPSEVLCNSPAPFCPPGEVPAVEGACWGDCVPILSCEPEPSCANCNTGFCAEYVSFTVEYRCVMPSLTCSALACSCLAPYFCVAPFDACSESPMEGYVSCGCPAC